MPEQIDFNSIVRDVGSAISLVSQRIRKIETQVEDEPSQYLVAGSHLTANSLVGALSVNVSTFPVWAQGIRMWIVIDAGTNEAEIRQITTVATEVVSFTIPLSYAHVEGDPIIFIEEPVALAKWFGAVGDGVANEALSLQRAVDQLAILGGGVLRIAPGAYLVGSTITVTTNGISIIGSGSVITTLGKSHAGYIIHYDGADDFEIKDMSLTDSGGSGSDRIRVDGSANFIIKNVRLNGVPSYNGNGMNIVDCSSFFIENLHITGYERGIVCDTCATFSITSCAITALNNDAGSVGVASTAIGCYSCSSFIVSRNTLSGDGFDTDYGVRTLTCDHFSILGNTSNDMQNRHFSAEFCNYFTISGNTAMFTANEAFIISDCTFGMLQGNVSNLNARFFGGHDNSDVLLGGHASGEAVILGAPSDMNSCDRLKMLNVITEFIPANDMAEDGAGVFTLVNSGPANENPNVWFIPSQAADFQARISAYFRIPHHLFGQTIYITPVWYWMIDVAPGIIPIFDVTTNIGMIDVATGSSNIYQHLQNYQASNAPTVIIDPWWYYLTGGAPYSDWGETKQLLFCQFHILKSGWAGVTSGAVTVFGLELRFSNRMEG